MSAHDDEHDDTTSLSEGREQTREKKFMGRDYISCGVNDSLFL